MKKLLHSVVIFLAGRVLNKVSFSVIAICCLMLSTSGLTYAQGAYPFPQNVDYSFGLKPENVNSQVVKDAFDKWKSDFVTSTGACGERRVIFDYYPGTGRGKEDRSRTVSEGIAYGMLIAAYMDDKALFDDLWDYYKKNRNQHGVMNWRIDNCSASGQNGASDAELDVAMALIVASHQWQSDSYVNDAKSMIRIIREKEFEYNNGSPTYVLKPGDMFGGSGLVCPSYFSPAYYRVFKDYDSGYESFWDNAANKGYEIINASTGASGLVPDWCTAQGTVSGEAASMGYEDQGKNFIFDAIRTPFRSGLDYLWHGNAQAKAYCAKVSDWLVKSHNSANDIGSKYGTKLNNNDGQKLGSYKNNTFIGCFAVGIMGSDLAAAQNFLNGAYSTNVSTNPGYGEYFNASFKLLSLMVMTGNFYLPPPDQCESPDLGEDVSLCSGNITLNAGITNRTYVWKKNGVVINGKTAQTLAVTEAGSYEVVATDPSGCVRRDKVEVAAATVKADFIAKAGPGSIILQNTSIGGITNYTWTIDDTDPQTDMDYTYTNVVDGSHVIKLVVDNTGYGCTGTSTLSKTVVVGAGVGVAVDDFVEGNDRKIYGFGFDGIASPPKKKCAADATAAECPDYPCGLAEMKPSGAPKAWGGFGFTFETADAPYNLTDVPYVSVKVYATKPVELGVKLIMQGSTFDISSDSKFIEVTTEPQIFTLDYTDVTSGWDNKKGTSGGTTIVAAWDKVNGIQFRPFEKLATYDGTIYLDWFIVGAKGLPAPTMSLKVDEDGYTDYSNYLPTYYPNDPQYAACKTSTASCYGKVKDWLPKISLCSGGSEVIKVKSCTAEKVRWYKGTTFLKEGDSYEVTQSGKYFVELINQGGIYRDSVEVTVGEELVADFAALIEPQDKGRGVRFINNSLNYHTWEWDYGTTDIEAGAEAWEEGYNYYKEDKTYTVCLTVNDTVCNQTLKECKPVVIKCDAPLSAISNFKVDGELVANDTITTCGNVSIEVTIDEVTNAAAEDGYGWFGIEGTTISTTNSVSQIFAESQMLKVEAYNECGEKVKDSVYIKVIPAPVAAFTAERLGTTGQLYALEAEWVGSVEDGAIYTWTADGLPIGTNDNYIEYEVIGSQDIKLVVTNACGTDNITQPVGCDLPVTTAAEISGEVSFCGASTCETYTVTGITGATSYAWSAVGGSVCTPSTTTSANVSFTTTGTVSVIASNTCGAAEAVELEVVINSAPVTSAIDGSEAPLCSATNVVYSVVENEGSSYEWTVPEGATIASGNGTNRITVNFGVMNGTVSVVETSAAGCVGEEVSLDVTLEGCALGANFSVNPTAVCTDAAITIRDLSTGVTPNTTYFWDFGEGATPPTSDSKGPHSVTYATGGAKTITLTIGNGVTEDTKTMDIEVGDKPVVSPNASIDGVTEFCGASTCEAYTVSGIEGATSYTWSATGGIICGSSTTASSQASFTTSGLLTVTAKNACGSADPVNLDVTISTKPNTSAISGNSKPSCGATGVAYSVTGLASSTFEWTLPEGATIATGSGTASITVNFGTASGNISVLEIAAGGCEGTEKVFPVTLVGCDLAANFTVSSTTVCQGTAVTFTDKSVDTTPNTVYTWSFGTGATPPTASTKGPHSVTYATGGVKVVELTVANGTITDTYPMEITVNAKPEKAGAIDGPATACQGVTEIYSIAEVAGATEYVWTNGSTTLSSTGTSASVKFGATNSTITVTPKNACGTGGQTSTTVTVEASTGLVSISGLESSTCDKETFYNTNAIPGATYTWTVPLGTTISNGQGTNRIQVKLGSTNGQVTVTTDVVSTGNCAGAGNELSLDVTIACSTAGPEISGPTVVGPDETATYFVPNNPGSSYTWTVPDGAQIIGSQTGNQITVIFGPTTSGNITVVENRNGQDLPASSLGVSNVTSTNDAFAINYDMYPNPFASSSTIRVNTPSREAIHISIIDERGLLVSEVSGKYSNEAIELGNELKSGIYFVKLSMNDKTEVVKLVKIK